jgi:hypothetical protein
MKVLVAAARTQGVRANDHNWCIEGELVRIGEVCARDRAERREVAAAVAGSAA